MSRGRLQNKQLRFTELVADGMDEREAIVAAGYSDKNIPQALHKLKNNKRVQERIELLQQEKQDSEILSPRELMAFWSEIVRDPKHSLNQRQLASDKLAKALKMFIDRKEIDTNINQKAVMLIPDVSSTGWDAFWEENN